MKLIILCLLYEEVLVMCFIVLICILTYCELNYLFYFGCWKWLFVLNTFMVYSKRSKFELGVKVLSQILSQ